MQIVRRSPFPELDSMERRMRRFLEDVGAAPMALPAADVYETDGDYVFELEVPGFEEKQLTVQVSDHKLIVRGELAETDEEKGKTFLLRERLSKQFERRFELPPEVLADKVFADFTAGVLTVHTPKQKKAKPLDVAISAS